MAVTIDGWASVYFIDDDNRERLQMGAFTKSLQRRPYIPMLFNHDNTRIVGRWDEFWNDHEWNGKKGLWVRGVVFDPDMEHLVRTYQLRGLSIGYRKVCSREDEDFRYVTEVELMEVSLVPIPSNPVTLIHVVDGVTK